MTSAGHQKCFAVLTGDLVRSTDLPLETLERTRDALPGIIEAFQRGFPGSVEGQPEFFRGDSWQLLMRRPEMALRMAVVIMARWKSDFGIGTRTAIGMGQVSRVVEDKISLSIGEAFSLSGRALDGMTGYFTLTGVAPERTGALAVWLPSVLHLCGQIMDSWTRRQAEIVASVFINPDANVEAVAAAMRPAISKQAAYKSLQAANWRGILDALRVFETTDWDEAIMGQPGSIDISGTPPLD
jgi:hypothetical protein